MALAKNIRMPHDSCPHESLQVSDLSSGFVFRATKSNNYEPDQVINFKSGYLISNSFIPNNESLLSFEKNNLNCESNNFVYLKDKNEQDELQSGGICDNGGDLQLHHEVDYPNRGVSNYPWNQTTKTTTNNTTSKEDINNGDEGAYGWLYSEEPTHLLALADAFQQPQTQQDPCFHKRGPNMVMGENMQPLKKQCTKKPKPKSSSPSKDPQSIAAKNRRERISERLKVLQELVPNGCKVDLVTMLEKAISYVKFLQLQVKVLATDEFWPVQGRKAPDISQVKEAIDAILTSQRETSSSSK